MIMNSMADWYTKAQDAEQNIRLARILDVSQDLKALSILLNGQPLIFKIAGAWGNHEGSMLLLILVLLIYNTIFLLTSKLDLSITINTVAIQTAIVTLFEKKSQIVNFF